MKTEQAKWHEQKCWNPQIQANLGQTAQLVIVFGGTSVLKEKIVLNEIRAKYPKAHLWGCSTAGEILDTEVSDESLVITAVEFEHTQFKISHTKIDQMKDSFEAGKYLTQSLPKEDLVHLLVLSDGLRVNGSELVRGLTQNVPDKVIVTGGLSGDGGRFKETLVLCDDILESGVISVLGLYGKRLKVGYGSMGGWDSFGPERVITKSKSNVLYEMDGKSALSLYKNYLGEHAQGLPAAGLFFPLSLRREEGQTGVVRTLLAVNEQDQSMTFAGDVPEGSFARLMKANFNRLIDGAIGAAKTSYAVGGSISPDLAIAISCVGRKMVLKQRVEEEIEGVREIVGEKTAITGFYSYGEIAPFTSDGKCELHNQTMTITTLLEE